MNLDKLVAIGAAVLGVGALAKGQTLTGAVALGGALVAWKGANAAQNPVQPPIYPGMDWGSMGGGNQVGGGTGSGGWI